MSPPPPFFLVGCPRSGTTLLQRILSAHSQVVVPPETQFMRKVWRHWRFQHYDDAKWAALLDTLPAIDSIRDLGLAPEGLRRSLEAGPRDLGFVFHTLLDTYRREHGAALVGEKTPSHLLYASTLRTMFPDARFVAIVRDPRSVVLSLLKLPWTHGSASAEAARWRLFLGATREAGRRLGGRLHVLRYEDLVTDAEAEVTRLCAFLGIPFEPAMLSDAASGNRLFDAQREPWKEGVHRPIHRDSLMRRENELTAEQVRAIETRCLDHILRHGYRPRTAPVQLGPAWLADRVRARLRGGDEPGRHDPERT